MKKDLYSHGINMLVLLEKLQTIARNGLAFSQNPYDKERYSQLLELASSQYEKLLILSKDEIQKRFSNELGYITPKVGTEAALFNENGDILLIKRSDNACWALPGGWVEPCEEPEKTVAREIYEEVGLKVLPFRIVHAFGELPNKNGVPHSQVVIVYLCKIINGELKSNHEVLQIKYHNIEFVQDWHENHKNHAIEAYKLWRNLTKHRS